MNDQVQKGRAPRLQTPSGQIFVIRQGAQRVEVADVGGSLRQYQVGGLALLDGYVDEERCHAARGQVLIPWPNRIEDGCYRFGGREYQLPLSEPAQRNAIHGLARWVPWTLMESSPDSVRLGVTIFPQAGYDFALHVSAEYRLLDSGLEVHLLATNVGDAELPFGAGPHPYSTLGTEKVDDLVVRMSAATRLEADQRRIPTGRQIEVAGSEYDLRAGRRLGPTNTSPSSSSSPGTPCPSSTGGGGVWAWSR